MVHKLRQMSWLGIMLIRHFKSQKVISWFLYVIRQAVDKSWTWKLVVFHKSFYSAFSENPKAFKNTIKDQIIRSTYYG